VILSTCCAGGAMYRWYCVYVGHVVLVYMWYYEHIEHVVLCTCGTTYLYFVAVAL